MLTTSAARALWPLRELVGEGPVRAAFLRVAPRDAWAALQDEPAARHLVDALEAYRDTYGQRCRPRDRERQPALACCRGRA